MQKLHFSIQINAPKEKVWHTMLGDKLVDEIEKLLKRKRAGDELELERRIEIINKFLEEKIEHFQGYVKTLKSDKPKQEELLNNLFRETIRIE